jgi:GPH family glycoside/pentoside/hexuronide:cation symporter
MKKPLSKTIKRFYGIADFGFGFMAGGMETPYLVFFMTNVAHFSLQGIAIATTIASTIDAFMQPVYGGIITGTRAGKHGRNRSWLVLFPLLTWLTFITLFTAIGTPTTGVIIVGASLCLTNAMRTLPWVSHMNLINVLASNADERAQLSSVRGTWSTAGTIVTSIIVLPIIGFFGRVLGNQVHGYTIAAALMGFVYCVLTWITFAFTKGYEEPEPEGAHTAARKVTVLDMLKAAATNPPLLILLIADFFKYMAGFVSGAAAAYYFNYILRDLNKMPIYLFLGGICMTLGASQSGRIAKALSTKQAAIIGILGQGIAMILNAMLARNMYIFFVLLGMTRLFGGVTTAAVVALYSDCVVYSKWKTNKNTAPFIMGSMTFALKLSYIARGTLVPFILALVGFSASIAPADATEMLKSGILNVFLLIPGLCLCLSGLLLTFGYRLTKTKVAELQAEIDARPAAEPATA